MILVDDREYNEHPDLTELISIETRIERLNSADYAFMDINRETVGVERCEISNLIQKIKSGELEQQLSRCVEDYSRVILLVEGVFGSIGGFVASYKKTTNGFYRNHIFARTTYNSVMALLIRLSDLGIEILQTSDFDCSMYSLVQLYEQRNTPEEEHTFFRRIRQARIPTKLSNNPTVPRLLALCPRLPERTAVELVNKYGTIWNIVNTPEKELLKTEGLGKVLVRRLKGNIGYEKTD